MKIEQEKARQQLAEEQLKIQKQKELEERLKR